MLNASGADGTMLIAAGLVVAGVIGVLIFVMPLKARLTVLALLAVPQVIVPGLIESASIFQVWVVAASLVMMVRERPRFAAGPVRLLLGLAGLALLALIWSPMPNIALISAIQVTSLAAIAVQAAAMSREDPRGLVAPLIWLSFGVIVEAALVFSFRLQPVLEQTFLLSPLARVLIGSDKISGFFGGSPDNVLDPEKSGGLWLNANTASMFLGVAACAFLSLFKRYGTRWFLLTGFVAGSAVYFTGSKTGLILLLAMPFLAWLVPSLCRPAGRMLILPSALLFYPAMLLIQQIANLLVPNEFATDSSLSFASRTLIWNVAGELFTKSWFLGLGFGGWGENFYAYSGGALGRAFPPHNILIAAWSDAGILHAILLAVIIVAVICEHLLKMGCAQKDISQAWGWSLAAFAWLWIHGMADAVTFYGDLRTMAIPGVLLSFLLFDPAARAEPDTPGDVARPLASTPMR